MEGINGIPQVQGMNLAEAVGKAEFSPKLLDQDAPNDTVQLSTKKSNLTVEQKQEIMQEARTKASGFSILFGFIDTLYYGLRSDETVAKKFNLDTQKDKKFIKEIKKQQMLWTLPSLIPGFGIIPGVVSWLYNKNIDSSKIKIN